MSAKKMQLLSGGRKSHVAFETSYLSNTNFLVLKEPYKHLNTTGLETLIDILKNFTSDVLMVSQDISVVG